MTNKTLSSRLLALTGTLKYPVACILTLLLVAIAPPSLAKNSFLPVNDAFRLTLAKSDSQIQAHWAIAPGYYLYQSRMSLVSEGGSVKLDQVRFPLPPQEKQDPYFGKQLVFHDKAEIQTSYVLQSDANPPPIITISYQGCAEAGLCYPPQTRNVSLADADFAPLVQTTSIEPTAAPLPKESAKTLTTTQTLTAPSEASVLASLLQNSNLWMITATFFLLGLGLTFTPCVLPMIPILSSIIAGQKAPITHSRGMILSTAYVLGMASTYTTLGILVGYFGAKANLQAWMQQPWVLSLFSVLFLLLALSMFGLYELQLPNALRNRLDDMGRRQEGGQLMGVTLMGVISALVVSPCVSAPLAGALLYISSTGDALLGGTALLALSLGMGTPLIVIGTTGAKLMPKAGAWMEKVKQFFGIILVGVALWLLQRVLPETLSLLLWALLFITSGLHLGAFQTARGGWQHALQAVGIIIVLWGGFIVSGVAIGHASIETPLGGLSPLLNSSSESKKPISPPLFSRVSTKEGLSDQLRQGSPVILDLYAKWCISCIEMEKSLFSNAAVRALSNEMHFVQLDLTEFTEEQKNLLDRFQLAGPPAILFFNPQGQEISVARIAGETTLEEFTSAVNTFRAHL